jgi:hypothetical protein
MALRGAVKAGDVQELMIYDDQTGKLYWRERSLKWFNSERNQKAWNSRYARRPALTTIVKGYLAGSILNRHIYAHRAAWCCMFGRWPSDIDHINGDKTDNRLANLREVQHFQNMRNMPMPSTNTSGVVGVNWLADRGVWRASIGIFGKTVFLGEYDQIETAMAARAAAEKVAGFHENHGRAALISQETDA